MTASRDEIFYQALLDRDASYEGFAYVGVKTTGIFCRFTCTARKPKRENVVFFTQSAQAIEAGFRACKRCRPLGMPPTADRARSLAEQVRADPLGRWDSKQLRELGFDPSSVRRAFRQQYGVTFAHFARTLRLGQAAEQLQQGGSVIQAQFEAGFESSSGFRDAISKLLGAAPAKWKGQAMLTGQWIETPIGAMLAVADAQGLRLLEFFDRTALPTEIERLQRKLGPVTFGSNAILEQTARELAEYYEGRRTRFSIPVSQQGTEFEQLAWEELLRIPSGETRSYGEMARSMGRPQAVRAVARANGANQVAVLIPCHRVIGSDGKLVGYAGKLWRKKWLLEHERRMAAQL
jgi:AraC family transcriptional regulator of adaptative response/methylated-DNA-[protein]-cysteine methyltransferase